MIIIYTTLCSQCKYCEYLFARFFRKNLSKIFSIVSVRTRFAPKAQMDGQWPKEPKTMNLLNSGLETELSMSQVDNDHSKLVIARKNKTNSFEQEKFSSVKSKEDLFLYISLRLIQNYSSSVYSDLSLDFLMIPFVMGFFSFMFSSLLSSQPPTCRSNC